MAVQQNILLEAGTNEIEVLEFFLGGQSYGVNVLKIRQFIKYDVSMVAPVPNCFRSVLGNFLFQGTPTSLVDLNIHINVDQSEDPNLRRIILVCEFNNEITGFLTDGVNKIHRVSWGSIQSPPGLTGNASRNHITGIVIMNEKQIPMLDFEYITETISGKTSDEIERPVTSEEDAKKARRKEVKLLIADDSRMIRESLKEHLFKANYVSMAQFDNGLDIYNAVVQMKQKAMIEGRPITDYLVIIITDIEMPGMDGLTLCKRVKAELPEVRVLILSSLISEQMAEKCRQVSADEFISKKEINKLVDKVDQLCL
ncbi:MAG: chemotaxis protein CheV [SAR324 cluster bacterium]|nr:chemotaxis protein CheV [SAR324 cluster bacterium]